MQKNTIILIILIAFCQLNYGQNGAIAAGGSVSSSGGNISYTIGQIAQSYSSGANGSVAEGLQKPFEISTLGNDDFPCISLEMKVYPNPTIDNLVLKIGELTNENLACQLYDVTGKQIANEKIINFETQINLENLNAAIYFLEIKNQNKTIKTFKIIKN